MSRQLLLKTKDIKQVQWVKFYIFSFAIFIFTIISIFAVRDRVYDVEMCIVRFSFAFFLIFLEHYLFAIRKIRVEKRKIVLGIGLIFCAILVGFFSVKLLVLFSVFPSFSMLYVMVIAGVILCLELIALFLHGKISDTLLLSSIIFIIGTVYAFSYPAVTLISWDDQTHYERCVILSHFNMDHALLSDADSLLINSAYQRALNQMPVETVRGFADQVNEVYLSGAKHYEMGERLSYGQPLTYLPSAIALLIGRGLCLPYSFTFALGRWANTIVYSILLYLAMKKVKSGKLLFFLLSMFPTTLLLMSNYTYDSWGIGFTILAFAFWLEIMQDEERAFVFRDLIWICLCFALGCAAKPIYFPMILVFLFTPGSKISNQLGSKRYQGIILFMSVLLLASFVVPYLASGVGGNDMRGGTEVDSARQIHYIFEHILSYIAMLLAFLKDYWFSGRYIYLMAYLGSADYNAFLLLFVALICVLDKTEADIHVINWKNRIWTIILAIVTSSLIVTAIYISFNPVGTETIQGCQPRYLLPILPFVFYFLGDYRASALLKRYLNHHIFVSIISIISVIYTTYTIWEKCITVF